MNFSDRQTSFWPRSLCPLALYHDEYEENRMFSLVTYSSMAIGLPRAEKLQVTLKPRGDCCFVSRRRTTLSVNKSSTV